MADDSNGSLRLTMSTAFGTSIQTVPATPRKQLDFNSQKI
eukprot:COSAG02_NODE_9216_length_2285_cov_3.247484_3_plen_39_part_01